MLYNVKGYLHKSEQIVATSSNISEFDRPTILSNEGESKENGYKKLFRFRRKVCNNETAGCMSIDPH